MPRTGGDCLRCVRADVSWRGNVVEVDLELRGPAAEMSELSLATAEHGALAPLHLQDAKGSLPFLANDANGYTAIVPTRPVQPPVRARYRVASAHGRFENPAATTVGSDRLRLSGETAWLLPRAFDAQGIVAELRFDLGAAPHSSVASSFGAQHPTRVNCRGIELRRASFIAGRVNRARFETLDGSDEWAWLEVLGFDARPVAGEAAALRTELLRYFEAQAKLPFVTLLLSEVREDGGFSVVSRARGLLVQLSVDAGWSAGVRLSVTRELFRPWFGDELRLSRSDGQSSWPELWFNEGVARLLARELAFRFGAINVDEHRSEMNELIATEVLSAYRGQSLDELARRAAAEPLARRQLIARGALYGTALVSLLRARSNSRYPFDGVLRELFRRARSSREPFTLSKWLEVLNEHNAREARTLYERIVEHGDLSLLPRTALGSCLRLEHSKYEPFSLGFDLAATRAASEGTIEGLAADGPATRAGVRSSDRFVTIHFRQGDTQTPIQLELKRDARALTITYRPVGERRAGPTWTRVAGVPDAGCY